MNLEMRDGLASPEMKEVGANVRIVLKFIRHGERTKEGMLTDYGRKITQERARESDIKKEDYNFIRAIGSNVDAPEVEQDGIVKGDFPYRSESRGRSLETAHDYAHEIAGDEAYRSKRNDLLNYENIVSPPAYDHKAIYNSLLPDNFDDLPDEEKVQAAKVAQTATVNHLLSLKTPEAIAYKREATGGFAVLIDHCKKVAERIKSESKGLFIAGTHGGLMELPLEAALVRVNEARERKIGFKDIQEIGGEMDPSEAFNVIIETDENGELLPLKVTFDRADRPQEEMYLDQDILKEAKEFYLDLHKTEDIEHTTREEKVDGEA